MSYGATVYEIFIASPSDVMKERDILVEEIFNWNRENSKETKKVLMPVRWEDDTYSTVDTQEVQEYINDQIKNESDLVIGIFHAKLGSPTKNSRSGTIQEIEEHVDARKPAMLFFSNADIPRNLITSGEDQSKKVEEFKNEIGKRALYKSYNNIEEFRSLAKKQINKMVRGNSYFKKNLKEESPNVMSLASPSEQIKSGTELFSTSNKSFKQMKLEAMAEELEKRGVKKVLEPPKINENTDSLFDKSEEIVDSMDKRERVLLKLASTGEGEIINLKTKNGGIKIGEQLMASVNDNKSFAFAKDALEKLVDKKLIEDRTGNERTYYVTKKGYQIAEKLPNY